MSLLDRKLRRDLRALQSQALAVALVMACGLAMMITTRSLMLSLQSTRTSYYEQHRFADVFARLKRAPEFGGGTNRGHPRRQRGADRHCDSGDP
jgi:putative ABC transport system permease protein